MNLPSASRRYAEVIGDPIGHSKSPLIHNFWLAKLGIAEKYWYRAWPVKPEGLADYIAERRADPLWLGCNVTIPHKQAIMSLLDDPKSELERAARRIGAANTVLRQSDGLPGVNTDYSGFFEPLTQLGFGFAAGQRALILGCGGAARAILARLDDARAASVQPGLDTATGAIAVAARDRVKAQALLRELTPGQHHVVVDLAQMALPAAADAPRYDLVVNASPLGMTGQPPLNFDLSHVAPGGIVYDIVYSPLETPLLAAARARGLVAVDGLTMLIGQAAVAFRLFFGADAPRDDDEELRRLLTA
jgi:shikimate dehydrogenase